MKFISSSEPDDDFTERLSSRVIRLKDNERFQKEYMAMNIHDYDVFREGKAEGIAEGKAEGLAQGRNEGIAEGLAEGKAEQAKMTAKSMLADNIPLEKIQEYTGLSKDEIELLR